MIEKSLNYMIKQEVIINELRTFIEIYLHDMIEFVEKEQGGICQAYLQEVGQALPNSVKTDPFSIFQMYKSQVSQRKTNDLVDQLRDEIEFLKEQIAYKDNEHEALYSVINKDTLNALQVEKEMKEQNKMMDILKTKLAADTKMFKNKYTGL